MSNREDLKLIIYEADALLSDTSIFSILGLNNPVDKVFDKIAGKGYYLAALGALTVLGLYSRIYFALKSKPPRVLSEEQTLAITKIKKLIADNKLESYFIQKQLDSISSSDEDSFVKFMDYLRISGIDLGLKNNEFRIAWKQIRNMISHLTFPLRAVGGTHIDSTKFEAIKYLNLPIYNSVDVMEIMRKAFLSTEAFKMDYGFLTMHSSVLLAYIYPIRDILIKEVASSTEKSCEIALNSVKAIFNRQKVKLT